VCYLRAQTTASECSDRLVLISGLSTAERLRQESRLSAPAQQIASKEGDDPVWEQAKFPIRKKEAIPAGRRAGGKEIVTQIQIAREVYRRWLGIQKAIRSKFDLEAISTFGPNRPAGPITLL